MGDWHYTDRRGIKKAAETSAVLPAQTTAQPPAVVASSAVAQVDDIDYDLIDIEPHWHDFLTHHQRQEDSKRWIDDFKTLLAGIVGEANSLTMGGRKVATFRRDARLNLSALAAEQPDIVERYTRIVAERKFDEAAFKAEMPQMYAAYRGRSLRLLKPAKPPRLG